MSRANSGSCRGLKTRRRSRQPGRLGPCRCRGQRYLQRSRAQALAGFDPLVGIFVTRQSDVHNDGFVPADLAYRPDAGATAVVGSRVDRQGEWTVRSSLVWNALPDRQPASGSGGLFRSVGFPKLPSFKQLSKTIDASDPEGMGRLYHQRWAPCAKFDDEDDASARRGFVSGIDAHCTHRSTARPRDRPNALGQLPRGQKRRRTQR